MPFSRNPDKYEARALKYEQAGKAKKAEKNRMKAAKIRAAHPDAATKAATGTVPATVVAVPARTPAMYEQNALKWEQKGNYEKAQKNREKVWRLQNSHPASVQAPSFYNQNQFVGYSGPFTQTTTTQQTGFVQQQPGFVQQQTGFAQQQTGFAQQQTGFVQQQPGFVQQQPGFVQQQPGFVQQQTGFAQQSGVNQVAGINAMAHGDRHNPATLEAKALQYEQRGKVKKSQKLRAKAAQIRNSNGAYTSTRTPAIYEQNAAKWEQRGNYTKAQKNREKVWRLQNPQYVDRSAYPTGPQFYNNNQFLGYSVPYNFQQQQNTFAQTSTRTVGATVETRVHPTIVEQSTRQEIVTEVQPVIHREIDAPQVRVVEKHIYETVPSTGPSVVTRSAIVEETVKPRIIEEIQPVVHREVPVTHVEHVQQHVTEHVVLPTTSTRTVVQDPTVHVAGGAQAVVGGAVGVQQTVTTTTTQQQGVRLPQ